MKPLTRLRIRFITASILIVLTMAFTGCKKRGYRLFPPPLMEQQAPFRATLMGTDVDRTESKHFGTVVVIYLKTETGETIGFGGPDMSNEFEAFSRTLDKGRTYEFPGVWLDYKKKRDHNK